MWVKKKPEFGDQIRVNRGLYYHHGIYRDDNCVYQFAVPGGKDIDPENARVCICTLEAFLKGGELEVREYSEEEKKTKRNPLEVIEYAQDHLGEAGYNLLTNNCEHFSNRCVFKEEKTTQVDDILKKFMEALK